MMRSVAAALCRSALFAAVVGGCGNVSGNKPASDADSPGALGTQTNPARTCNELHVAGMASGAYWVRDPQAGSPPVHVYCEQELNGGGWVMVENSVYRDDGTTTLFWQLHYADRLRELGTLAPDQNYYNGSLYLIGTEYMDVFVDLTNKAAVAAVMTASGFTPDTMQFKDPKLTVGDQDVFTHQFASGWAAQDYDGDPYAPYNCAGMYSNVAQHYGTCWVYSLGSDAGTADNLDGGVGPHVRNQDLTALGLAAQDGGGDYSRVRRIARFTRW